MTGNEHARRGNARRILRQAGYNTGGHLKGHSGDDYAEDKKMIEKAMSEHDRQQHGGRHTKLKLADGGVASGPESAPRADRGSRGKKSGKSGAKTHIAIMVAPQGQDRPVPVPVPVGGGPPPGGMPPRPPMPPPGPPGGMPPPGMGGPPPGMPPGGMPPGGPMMRKAGGRTEGWSDREHHRDGGRAKKRPHRDAGGGTGAPQGFGLGAPPPMPTGQDPLRGGGGMGGGPAGMTGGPPAIAAANMAKAIPTGGFNDPNINGGVAPMPGSRASVPSQFQFQTPTAASAQRAMSQPIPTGGFNDPNKNGGVAPTSWGTPAKKGGRAKHADGGEVGPGRVHMTAGAGSGEGRQEKSRALPYGEHDGPGRA